MQFSFRNRLFTGGNIYLPIGPHKDNERGVGQTAFFSENGPRMPNKPRYQHQRGMLKPRHEETSSFMYNTPPPQYENSNFNFFGFPTPSVRFSPLHDMSGDTSFQSSFQSFFPSPASMYDDAQMDTSPFNYQEDAAVKNEIVKEEHPNKVVLRLPQSTATNVSVKTKGCTIESNKSKGPKEKVLPSEIKHPKLDRSLITLSGSVDKILKWEKVRNNADVLIEIIAPFVTTGSSDCRGAKLLLLRDQGTPVLQCFFYEIDRPLPPLKKGQLVRCVGKMVGKNKLLAFSVRPASSAERSGLQRIAFASQRAVAGLELATPEP